MALETLGQVGIGAGIAVAGLFVFLLLWAAGKTSFKPGHDALLKAGAFFIGGGMMAGGAYVAYQGWVGTPVGPPPPPGPGAADMPVWEWRVYGDTDGNFQNSNHNANTEFPDSPFTACGSMSPAGTAHVLVTDTTYDTNSATVTIEYDVDDDVVTTVAGYGAPDCGNFDVYFKIANLVDGNDDSIMDEVPYFARWRSFSTVRTLEPANNVTQQEGNVFEWTTTAGWHFGFGEEVDAPAWAHAASDHGYAGSCVPGTAGYSTATLTQTCYSRWVPLGIYDDGDPDVINPWWVMHNSGPFGFRSTVGMTVKADMDVGVPGSFFTVHWVVRLDSIG